MFEVLGPGYYAQMKATKRWIIDLNSDVSFSLLQAELTWYSLPTNTMSESSKGESD